MKIQVGFSFLILMILSLASGITASQTDNTTTALSDRMRAIEDRLRSLEDQVSELTRLVKAVLPPSPIQEITGLELSVGSSPSGGSGAARVALIEYSDFECPFCGRHSEAAFRDVHRLFVQTGKVRYVFRHFPLEQLHPNARRAAEAAECAREQGKFWEMHDQLFANQKSLSRPDLSKHAQALGLNVNLFDACLDTHKPSARIDEDLQEAKRLGLTGTLSFFIGVIDGATTIRVLKKIEGAQQFTIFQLALETVLSEASR